MELMLTKRNSDFHILTRHFFNFTKVLLYCTLKPMAMECKLLLVNGARSFECAPKY